MPKEYLILFNAITDAIRILMEAQQLAEELSITRQILPFPQKQPVRLYLCCRQSVV